MACLGLGHDEGIIRASQRAQGLCFFARNINGAFARELDMVHIQCLVVKRLEGPFRQGNETHREIQAGEPDCSFDELREMRQIDLDVGTRMDTAYGRAHSNSHVWLDHSSSPFWNGCGAAIAVSSRS